MQSEAEINPISFIHDFVDIKYVLAVQFGLVIVNKKNLLTDE
jgi:hypothetical protein